MCTIRHGIMEESLWEVVKMQEELRIPAWWLLKCPNISSCVCPASSSSNCAIVQPFSSPPFSFLPLSLWQHQATVYLECPMGHPASRHVHLSPSSSHCWPNWKARGWSRYSTKGCIVLNSRGVEKQSMWEQSHFNHVSWASSPMGQKR